MEFRRATRKQLKVKVGLMGTAGTGKSWTALSIAEALGSKIAVIDSERGRAEAYAGEFEFDHLPLPDHSPETYIAALGLTVDGGYDVVVIDGLSQEWVGRDGILSSVDRFGGWKDATPRHDAFVEAVFRLPKHVIATMRAKTQYQVEEIERDGRKRQEITKLGVGPVQRDNLEYEFDLLGMMELDHSIRLHKSVIALLPSGMRLEPGESPRALGREIAHGIRDWINRGEPVAEAEEAGEEKISWLYYLLEREGFGQEQIETRFRKRRLELGALTDTYVDEVARGSLERLAGRGESEEKLRREYSAKIAATADEKPQDDQPDAGEAPEPPEPEPEPTPADDDGKLPLPAVPAAARVHDEAP